MGMSQEQVFFESAIRALESEVANIGVYLELDSSARRAYANQIRSMALELKTQASLGKITWLNAAEQAQEVRNLTMEMIRSRSSPVGLAMAQRLKSEGKTLNELIAKKTKKLFGPKAVFTKMTPTQQNSVYAEIVKVAGKSNPKVTAAMRKLTYAGRGLIVFSIALSIYTVTTADDKLNAAGRELAITGAGVGGGVAGGALAGLACGPGAPVCVTIGAFAGGALVAFGVSIAW